MKSQDTWLTTGCSTGFGWELATLLLAQGYRVAATARYATKLQDLVKDRGPNALVLSLDVTDKVAIHAAVAAAQQHFGQIDVLVNNAGYGYLAAIE